MGRHHGDSGITRAQALQAEVRRRQRDRRPYRPGWGAVAVLTIVLLLIALPIIIWLVWTVAGGAR